LAVSMATAAILKIQKVVCTSTQCLTFLWSFIDFRYLNSKVFNNIYL
jgi:hypothetical protein